MSKALIIAVGAGVAGLATAGGVAVAVKRSKRQQAPTAPITRAPTTFHRPSSATGGTLSFASGSSSSSGAMDASPGAIAEVLEANRIAQRCAAALSPIPAGTDVAGVRSLAGDLRLGLYDCERGRDVDLLFSSTPRSGQLNLLTYWATDVGPGVASTGEWINVQGIGMRQRRKGQGWPPEWVNRTWALTVPELPNINDVSFVKVARPLVPAIGSRLPLFCMCRHDGNSSGTYNNIGHRFHRAEQAIQKRITVWDDFIKPMFSRAGKGFMSILSGYFTEGIAGGIAGAMICFVDFAVDSVLQGYLAEGHGRELAIVRRVAKVWQSIPKEALIAGIGEMKTSLQTYGASHIIGSLFDAAKAAGTEYITQSLLLAQANYQGAIEQANAKLRSKGQPWRFRGFNGVV